MIIQLYNGKKDNTGSEIDITAALRTITDGPELKQKTIALRKAIEDKINFTGTDADWKANTDKLNLLIDKIKGNLPAVTWSGTFTKRSITGIKEYSQLICLDIDKLHEKLFTQIRKEICEDPHTHICFTSPSGNGIKLIVKVVGTADQHKDFFLTVQSHFEKYFIFKIDPSGKDVSRLCFLCHDADLFINDNSKPFVLLPTANDQPPTTVKPLTKKEGLELQNSDTWNEGPDDFYSVLYFTDKFKTYTAGSRNEYIFLFANNCNRKGFSESDTLSFCTAHFIDIDAKEVTATVKSAYQHHVNEHAKYAKKFNTTGKAISAKSGDINNAQQHKSHAPNTPANLQGKPGTKPTDSSNKIQLSANGTTAKPITFWTEYTITKGKGKDKHDEVRHKINRSLFAKFLLNYGYHLINTSDKGFAYQLCYSQGNIVEPVEPVQIKKFILDYCIDNTLDYVEEMVREKTSLFDMKELNGLYHKKIQVKKDTQDESYFYFKNYWVAVSKEKITTYKYDELGEYNIWRGNKLDREFTVLPSDDFMNAEFAEFVSLVSWNPGNEDEKDFTQELIAERFSSHTTGLGFLLDGYKHPSDRAALVFLDHKISEKGERHGRTGKSMYAKACSFLKVTRNINGDEYNPQYQFKHEQITADAQIVNFNDMKPNFDMGSIYGIIADDYTVIRRNNGYVSFTYENSPKVCISMNAFPKGEGSSNEGRSNVLEFSDFFNQTNTPYKHFGHGFFSSAWDADEWNRFDNFLLWCVQKYKQDCFIKYPKANIEERKLKGEVDEVFIDYLDELPRNTEHNKDEVLEKIRAKLQKAWGGGKPVSSNSLTRWIKRYCKTRGVFFNPHKAEGKRDMRHEKGELVEYITIATTANWKPEENTNTQTIQTTLL